MKRLRPATPSTGPLSTRQGHAEATFQRQRRRGALHNAQFAGDKPWPESLVRLLKGQRVPSVGAAGGIRDLDAARDAALD